jgi:hypothetical protein
MLATVDQMSKWALNIAGNAPASALEREQRDGLGRAAAKRKRDNEHYAV